MNTVKKILLPALAALALAGCLFKKEDVKTVAIHTPGMKNEECAAIIQKALSALPGVTIVLPDAAGQKVSVTYDSMSLAIKNLEYAVAEAGFDANEIKAKPEAAAALPASCR